jgi:hypothetical protein
MQRTITDPGILKDTFKNANGIFPQAAIPSMPRSAKDSVTINDVESGIGQLRCVWQFGTFS